MECKFKDCQNPTKGLGLCSKHYDQYKYHSDPVWRERKLSRNRKWHKENLDPKDEQERKRSQRYMLKYGFSTEFFDALRRKQQFRCAICNVHEDNAKRGRLCVDHCHRTGIIRGMLCVSCNTALGLLAESAPIIQSAADYVKGWDERLQPDDKWKSSPIRIDNKYNQTDDQVIGLDGISYTND